MSIDRLRVAAGFEAHDVERLAAGARYGHDLGRIHAFVAGLPFCKDGVIDLERGGLLEVGLGWDGRLAVASLVSWMIFFRPFLFDGW